MRKHMSVKKMATEEVRVFSWGKTAEKGSVSVQTGRKTSEDRKVCFNFLIFKKIFFEIYIKFACWWRFDKNQTNKSSVIASLIGYDRSPFGNWTLDFVRLTKFYCDFDYVRIPNPIERLGSITEQFD